MTCPGTSVAIPLTVDTQVLSFIATAVKWALNLTAQITFSGRQVIAAKTFDDSSNAMEAEAAEAAKSCVMGRQV